MVGNWQGCQEPPQELVVFNRMMHILIHIRSLYALVKIYQDFSNSILLRSLGVIHRSFLTAI